MVGGFASNLDTSWANPNEDRDSVQSTKQSLEYLNQSFHEISCIANNKEVPETLSHPQVLLRNGGANPVIIKPLSVANFIESGITDLLLSSREHANIGTLSILGSNKVQNHEKLSLAEFVQHLTHPKVVTAIASVIQSRTPKRKCCEVIALLQWTGLCCVILCYYYLNSRIPMVQVKLMAWSWCLCHRRQATAKMLL